MGLDINSLRFLLDARQAGVSFSTTLTIGRQGLFVEADALSTLLAAIGRPSSQEEAARLLGAADGFCEPFLELLGAGAVESVDISDYQKATILHDMNEPIPESLRESFSAVIDSGSLEHIFNFPQAVRNCMEMVEVGGYFLCMTTANNFMGHGFYQFSPELFYRVLSPENGFTVERMVAYEERWGDLRYYEVPDAERVGRRVTLVSRYPTCLLIRAKRVARKPIFATVPQQSDYSAIWKTSSPGSRAADAGRLTERESVFLGAERFVWRWMKPLLPAPLRKALRRRRRGPDPFDPALYARTTLPGQ